MEIHKKIKEYIGDNMDLKNSIIKKTGISDDTLSAILNGEKPLYADEFRSICLALNVSPEIFMVI